MFGADPPLREWSSVDEERSLAILCQLILEEIDANASLEQRRGLLVAVGRRVAGLIALRADADLETLAARAGELWSSLNWGSVGFRMDDEGIDIIHRGLPVSGREQLQDWDDIVPPLLEGAYAAWFEQIGGASDRLRTRVVRHRRGEVDLRHGL